MTEIFRWVVNIFTVSTLCISLPSSLSGQHKNPLPTKMNVLFIAVDDLRPDLGCYGNPVISTPNIDRLADEAVVFERAYCNVSVCGASRASLLTGTRPTDYRFLNFRSRADRDNPEVITLPAHFRGNGYYTLSLGKIFHFPDDSKESWDVNTRPRKNTPRDYLLSENTAIDTPEKVGMAFEAADVPDSAYADGRMALQAVRYLDELSASGKPFFFAVGFFKPHLPFNAPKRYWDLYDPAKIGLSPNPDPPEHAPKPAFHPWKELRSFHGIPGEGKLSDDLALTLRHGYYACISYTDAQVGLLLDELKRTGLDKNTIIVLWGDHGWNLGDNALWGKHCNFNKSMNAPLIIKVPGLTNGKTNTSITEFIDIYPTLAELCALPSPKHLDGQSLVGRLRKPEKKESDYAISKFSNGVTLIKDRYFYSEWYDDHDKVIANMLYDHVTDPGETMNLSVKPEYAALVERLSKELRKKRGKDFFR